MLTVTDLSSAPICANLLFGGVGWHLLMSPFFCAVLCMGKICIHLCLVVSHLIFPCKASELYKLEYNRTIITKNDWLKDTGRVICMHN